MLVRFWGTRGSLPVAPTAATIRQKLAKALMSAGSLQFYNIAEAELFVEKELSFAAGATYGGATSCVELETARGSYFVCDMGSGLRSFGLDSLRRNAAGHSKTYNFFQSHLHWDHIMGFPFFAPAFDPSVTMGSREQILDSYRDVRDGLMRRVRTRFGMLGAGGV